MADVEKAKIEFLSNYARDLMVMNMQLTNQVMTFEYVKMFLTIIVVICIIFFLYYYFTCESKKENFMPYITTLQHDIKRSDPAFDKGYQESLMEQKEWRDNEDFLFDDLRSQEQPYDFDGDYWRYSY